MDTALKWHNRIFANVKSAVSGKCRTVVRTDAKLTDADYPAVAIQLLGSPGTISLENSDIGATITYQADVYAVDAQKISTASMVMESVMGAFRQMGFRADVSERPSQDNPDLYRLTGRFYRYVGSGDDIERI